MKEIGISFSPEMVQANLDRRKSMARWVVKPQPGGYVASLKYFKTEAQARAQKLIDALEMGWVTVDEVNQRINAYK